MSDSFSRKDSSLGARSALLLAASIASIACVLLAVLIIPQPYPVEEGTDYFGIATGDYSAVHYFYARRVLHPLTARFMAHIAGSSLPASFHALSILSVAVYFIAIFLFITAATNVVFALSVTPLLLTPQLIAAFREIYFPTLFFWALLAVFFLVLHFSFRASLLPLALLCFTRESSIVLVAAIVVGAMVESRQWVAVAAGAVGLVSLEVASMLIPQVISNVHHLSALAYYALKVLGDTAFNLLGVVVWTNTRAPFMGCTPRHVARVPHWVHFLGAVREIGLCDFDIHTPFKTILIAASAFGTMPALLVTGVVRFRSHWRALTFDVRVALIYGALAFATAPVVGTAPARYITEGFPAFWMAGLVVIHCAIGDRIGRATQFVTITLAAVWLPAVLSGGNLDYDPLGIASLTRITIALILVFALDGWAYRLIASRVPAQMPVTDKH
jgi:hypothetical protein